MTFSAPNPRLLRSSSIDMLLFPVLYFTTCFFYILWRLDPALSYQCQVPPFLCDEAFLRNFMAFPGGLSEYLSNLLSQFYYFPWIGAAIMTACLLAALLLMRAITHHLSPQLHNSLLLYIPSILMLILFSQYEHRLTYTLAWLQSLVCILCYLRQKAKPPLVRLGVFLLLSIVIYYTGASFMLLFALAAIIFEGLFRRNLLLTSFYLSFMIALPCAARTFFFILTHESAYLYLLLPIYDYRPSLTPYMLYLYLPLLFILAGAGFLRGIERFENRRNKKFAVALLILLTIAAALVSFDPDMRTILRVDYYAHHGQWQKLLDHVEEHPSDDILVAFQTNRALYHTGRMPSEMFAYDQTWGVAGLFLPPEARAFFSIQVSDLYWDLGFLNEAEHWVLEDHSNFSFSPWHLQRLALISILKGNSGLADMCLNALSKTILYRGWANRYRPFVTQPHRLQEKRQLSYGQRLYIDKDFIINSAFPEQDIQSVLAQNSENRMAFEYMMVTHMLTFRLGMLITALQSDRADLFLPKHYQEAVVVFLHNTQGQMGEIAKWLSPKTRAEFNDFMQILARHGNDATEAQDELREKYGRTYWYYSLFSNPARRMAQSK
ncbi:hypothetical protein JXA02_04775 [candidate division KSB1 bacterium]|nr:hypothetical protein [candidate division KSB1 bacterium]RQW08629.1 MAG: hypothetical protein EH222_05470 [candidate division KSB1 bacterium]